MVEKTSIPSWECQHCGDQIFFVPFVGWRVTQDIGMAFSCWDMEADVQTIHWPKDRVAGNTQSIYDAGESNMQADWEIALDDILPEGIECWPTQVRAYIVGLQSRDPA